MGVPGLFSYIIRNFPKSFVEFSQGEFSKNVDHLYIDANAILHKFCQLVFNYGENKKFLNIPYQDFSYEEKRKKVFQLFFNFIIELCKMVIPSKSLYISIDGPAPLAKQSQQRQRRFVSALSRSKESEFDSNVLTPGSIFMFELTKYINYRIRLEMQRNDLLRKIKIYFDPQNRPGEGEHKILDFIRKNVNEHRNFSKESHCIYGPDGDLIMLTLATYLDNIYLFRENMRFENSYHFIDMSFIRKNLYRKMFSGVFDPRNCNDKFLNSVTNDFILIGFFVGNDFLPKLEMFYTLEDGLNTMIKIYDDLSHGGKYNSLTHSTNNDINLKSFSKFVDKISSYEAEYIEKQHYIEIPDEKFFNKTVAKNIIRDIETGENYLNFENFRIDYYKKSGIETEEKIREMCSDYFTTLRWIYYYYTIGLPSWDWYYKWNYPPLIVDLSRYLKEVLKKDKLESFLIGTPLEPFEQLLSVLPSSSSQILPKFLQKLMIDENSVLVKNNFYPKSFEVDYEGKTKEHMAIVKLSFVKKDLIRSEFQKIKSRLRYKYTRNELGKVGLFYFDLNYKAKYISDYGILNGINIRHIYI